MSVQVRDATAADAAAIALLNRDVQQLHADAHPWRYKQPSDDGQFERDVAGLLKAPDYFAYLAVDETGAPLGYALAEVTRRPETTLHHAFDMIYVHQLSVAAAARRRGVGRALLEACKTRGTSLGIATLTLETWAFNERALNFFKANGLTPYSIRLWNRPEQEA